VPDLFASIVDEAEYLDKDYSFLILFKKLQWRLAVRQIMGGFLQVLLRTSTTPDRINDGETGDSLDVRLQRRFIPELIGSETEQEFEQRIGDDVITRDTFYPKTRLDNITNPLNNQIMSRGLPIQKVPYDLLVRQGLLFVKERLAVKRCAKIDIFGLFSKWF
jgi:hypothetical protein